MKRRLCTIKTYAIYDPLENELIAFYRLKREARARWAAEWGVGNRFILLPLTGTYAPMREGSRHAIGKKS